MRDHSYFKDDYKMIALDVNKQEATDADAKVIQQINITGNIARDGN